MTDHSDLFPIVSLSNIDLEPYELRTGTVNGYCTRIYGILQERSYKSRDRLNVRWHVQYSLSRHRRSHPPN